MQYTTQHIPLSNGIDFFLNINIYIVNFWSKCAAKFKLMRKFICQYRIFPFVRILNLKNVVNLTWLRNVSYKISFIMALVANCSQQFNANKFIFQFCFSFYCSFDFPDKKIIQMIHRRHEKYGIFRVFFLSNVFERKTKKNGKI